MVRRAVIAGLLAVLLGAAAGADPVDATQARRGAGSGIDGPSWHAIRAALGEVAAHSEGWAQVVDYGRSVGGQPLRLIRIAAPAPRGDAPTGPAAATPSTPSTPSTDQGERGEPGEPGAAEIPVVLITGATHGDEYLAIEDRLPGWLVEHRASSQGVARFLAAGGVILVAPIVNPDGYERHTRENNDDVDLNRDFDRAGGASGGEPETRALLAALARELGGQGAAGPERLRLTVDYHCCNGSLLLPLAEPGAPVTEAQWAEHVRIAHLAQQDIDGRLAYGATPDVLGYAAAGTSKDFYFRRHGALAFTYEGEFATEPERFDRHTVWWDHVLASLVP
jgi:hypothetical protein